MPFSGSVATERQRKRKERHRRNQPPGRNPDWKQLLLDPEAHGALPLRRLWVTRDSLELRAEFAERIMEGYPVALDPSTKQPLDAALEASEAWPYLEALHDFFVERIRQLITDRGSAEWLWWLRRLRGQFDDVNDMTSTGPYIESLAESLGAGVSRPSVVFPERPTFEFPLMPETLLDLTWLREISIMIYRLHAAMKRCAKGQAVTLAPGEIPLWEPDDLLDDAIDEYDGRTKRERVNLLQALGVTGRPTVDLAPEQLRIGGLVPWWYSIRVKRPPRFEKADPLPFLFAWMDLDAVAPLRDQAILAEDQVALILLLWAALNIGNREPEMAKRRMTPAFQWGYMVTHTDNFLLPALDEMCTWLTQGAGRAIEGCWWPDSGREILEVLGRVQPEVWPPLCGCPVHEAGDFSVTDLVGASRRLFVTLLRPADGPAVNLWSAHFERDVQKVLDETDWRPPDAMRPLIGRTIRRADGTALTDIDALGFNNGRLLLVSCKSIAFTLPALRGEFAVTRNIVEKTHAAAAEWDQVVRTLQADAKLLSNELPHSVAIEGCFVFPSVPFYTESQWRKSVFDAIPFLLSVQELSQVLEQPSFLDKMRNA